MVGIHPAPSGSGIDHVIVSVILAPAVLSESPRVRESESPMCRDDLRTDRKRVAG